MKIEIRPVSVELKRVEIKTATVTIDLGYLDKKEAIELAEQFREAAKELEE
jgi:membrane protein YdbS with pleckstrin-like domain